jgi:hypothetical protein
MRSVRAMTSRPVDSIHPTRGTLSLAVLLTLLLAVAAVPARSAETGAPGASQVLASSAGYERTLRQKLQAAYWRGRSCTTPACKSPRPGTIAEVASFGLAAFGGAWISRRRRG